MISIEGPLLAALIARLSDPTFNLAAYGVAFSFALVIEAPVIMIMSASTALVHNRQSFLKLRDFTFALSLAVTAVMVVFVVPPVFDWISLDLIGLPPEVARLTHQALLLLLPWPGSIGYRRFYQGLLIRQNLTRRVAYGAVLRVLTMGTAAWLAFASGQISGALLGALALCSGVVVEAVASRLMVNQVVRRLLQRNDTGPGERLSHPEIIRFYTPLALTSLLTLGVHPLITFMLGQSRLALESLAVLPVASSLVFIFRSFGLAFQEVAIALIGPDFEGYLPLRRFTLLMGIAATGGIVLIAFTPLQQFWFQSLSGLSPDLSYLAGVTLQLQFILPALSILLAFQRAMLVNLRTTRFITWATLIEVVGIWLVLVLAIGRLDLVGAVAASLALVLGRLGANLYLLVTVGSGLRRRLEKNSNSRS